MSKNDGGPAFPVVVNSRGGISTRDYFAAKALQGMLANQLTVGTTYDIAQQQGMTCAETFATAAYEYAGAMLKIREEPKS